MRIMPAAGPARGITLFILCFTIASASLVAGAIGGSRGFSRVLVVDARPSGGSCDDVLRTLDGHAGKADRAVVLVASGGNDACGQKDFDARYGQKQSKRGLTITTLGVGATPAQAVLSGVFGSDVETKKNSPLSVAKLAHRGSYGLGTAFLWAFLLSAALAVIPAALRPRGRRALPAERRPAPAQGSPSQAPQTREPRPQEPPSHAPRPPETPSPGEPSPPDTTPDVAGVRGPAAVRADVAEHCRGVGRARTHIDSSGGYAEFGGLVVWVSPARSDAPCVAPGQPVRVVAEAGGAGGLGVVPGGEYA